MLARVHTNIIYTINIQYYIPIYNIKTMERRDTYAREIMRHAVDYRRTCYLYTR